MKSSYAFMLSFWAFSFLATPFDHLLDGLDYYTAYTLVSLGISTFLMFAWFLTDANDINYHPSILFKIGVIVFAFALIPYYLIKNKGWNTSLVSFAKFAVFLVALLIYDEVFQYYYYDA